MAEGEGRLPDTVPTLTNLKDLLTKVTDIPAYEPLEPIARGGFSTVLKVRDSNTGHILALKKISMRIALDYYNGNVLKLLREVKVLKDLGPSPHVVAYVDHWVEESQLREEIETMFNGGITRFSDLDTDSPWWLDSAMPDTHLCVRYELCNYSLAKWLRGNQRGDVRPILKQLVQGISYLHDKSVVHRDISPANILCKIEEDTQVWKYADFGLANDVALEPSTSIGRHGTGTYRAPELWEPRAKNTYKSDIYSLGLVFLELITNAERNDGQPLFTKARRDNLELKELKIIQPENSHSSGFEATGGFVFENTDIRIPLESCSLWRLTWEMMRRDPDKRPSARKLVERLEQAEQALAFSKSVSTEPTGLGVQLHLAVDISLALHLNNFTRTMIQDVTDVYGKITSFLDHEGYSSPKLIHMTFIPGNEYIGLSDGEMINAAPEWYQARVEEGFERKAIAHIIGTTIMSIEKYDTNPRPPQWWTSGLSRYCKSHWYLNDELLSNLNDTERYAAKENDYSNGALLISVMRDTFGDACIQSLHRSGREGKFQEELDNWLGSAETNLDEMWDSLLLSHLTLS